MNTSKAKRRRYYGGPEPEYGEGGPFGRRRDASGEQQIGSPGRLTSEPNRIQKGRSMPRRIIPSGNRH